MSSPQEDLPLPPVQDLFPHLHANPSTLGNSVDPFTITTSTGFLPFKHPVSNLPCVFTPLAKLLDDLPIVKLDGTSGLLATFKLGPTVDGGALPDFTDEVDKLTTDDGSLDLAAVTAVFRDYSFLASAYLLEPCWENWSKNNDSGYGLGRAVLPREIAGPLMKTAKILDIPPFMSYAAAYALYNYSLLDPALGTSTYANLRMIRAFERGLDASSSEAGFVLTHVHMVQETAPLISGSMQLLSTISSSTTSSSTTSSSSTSSLADFPTARAALQAMLTAMSRIESHMEAMWSHSKPAEYLHYRTFIFGITNQSMFPHGVIYSGENANKPLFFRGESGANDSIIPLLDHLLQIPMPPNPLTDILKDFRNYRPKPHRVFLSYVNSKATEVGVREYCVRDPETAVLYLKLLDHVRSFRWRHWMFAREYILRRSSHPTATGGSPIVTWLPNQLLAVMDMMSEVYEDSGLSRGDGGKQKGLMEIMENVRDQREKLDKEVKKWCQERGA